MPLLCVPLATAFLGLLAGCALPDSDGRATCANRLASTQEAACTGVAARLDTVPRQRNDDAGQSCLRLLGYELPSRQPVEHFNHDLEDELLALATSGNTLYKPAGSRWYYVKKPRAPARFARCRDAHLRPEAFCKDSPPTPN